jgi:hydroxymethylbilane synthase
VTGAVSAPALRLATRGSRQALAQSRAVAGLIESSGRPVELVTVQTTGDARVDVPLHVIGGQGVFVKEVQRAVLDGRADLAVHSAKDLPSTPADGLVIGAFCRRRDPADALVGATLDGLDHGATVATGSVRRRAQLAGRRPDLRFVELRGNIDSRLEKIPAGGAILMAVAALEILELTDVIAERLDVDEFVPAVGQGCVAVECRTDDATAVAALAAIDDRATRHHVEVERAYLAELGSGCSLPVGAHAADGVLRTFLADTDAGRTVAERIPLDGSDTDVASAARAAHRAREALG